jgi:methylisocitrate lyase
MKKTLRAFIEQPGIKAAPAVYDCLGAMVAEQSGFEFIFTSGFGISAALLGKPDMGYLTAGEMIDAARRIANSVSIPVIADMDTGYGNPLNVIRTVQEIAGSKVAGIILEDQEWPKKCGHFEGKRVIPVQEQVEKIRAAVYARGESSLVIVGRTDARAIEVCREPSQGENVTWKPVRTCYSSKRRSPVTN